jgi:hypothetical protein
VARLVRDAADAGASLRVVEASARRAVADLVAEADRAQWESAAWRAELAAWTRGGDPAAGDGVPGYARGLGEAASALDRVLLRFAGRGGAEERRDRQHLLHTPALLALSTREDAPRDWATAGLAFERTLLRAAAADLSASYFSAAIEVPPARTQLREVLGEVGFPQVLLRVGYGARTRPTPRRPLEVVLRAYRAAGGPRTALAPRR